MIESRRANRATLRASSPRVQKSRARRVLLPAAGVSALLGVACIGGALLPGAQAVSSDATSLAAISEAQAQGYEASLVSGADSTVADQRGGELSVDAVDPHDPNAIKAIAQDMAATQYGWTGAEWTCLDKIWEKESNWNPSAVNPESGAYGIPQSYPGDKMATIGADWRTNPITQITWGMNYIRDVYGTPCTAWNQHNGSY